MSTLHNMGKKTSKESKESLEYMARKAEFEKQNEDIREAVRDESYELPKVPEAGNE